MDQSGEAPTLSAGAAGVYESTFVPAIFARWAQALVEAAGLVAGQSVLDVACGTGAVARAAADRLRATGPVVGVDVDPQMLAVARTIRPDLDWVLADAADLPFRAASFDVVLCQAALTLFAEPQRALREMARVARPRATLVAQVWSGPDRQPGWTPFHDVVRAHAGGQAVHLLGSGRRPEDPGVLLERFGAAGLRIERTWTRQDVSTFASVDAFVAAELDGTPLAERLDASVRERILAGTRVAMAPFGTADGRLEVPTRGILVVAHPQG